MTKRDLSWIPALRDVEPAVTHLSRAGARHALDAALDGLADVERHLDRPAPEHTVFVAARTVFTAPLEWIAVLTGRGGRVTVKSPEPLLPWFRQLESLVDGLSVTADRAVVDTADRVVAMGSDATIAALREQVGDRLLGFGARYSVAWWSDPARAHDLAWDLILHDGRGCMSPTAIFSPLPDAASLLHQALTELAVPRGPLAPIEAARIRERVALARVLGEAHLGTDHAVIGLPASHAAATGFPRLAVIHPASSPQELLDRLPSQRLSVIGTDSPLPHTPHRTAELGTMQKPPLDRLHDGVDWLRAV